MGLDHGEGKVYIRKMLEEFDRGHKKRRVEEAPIPIFHLMFSAKNDVQVYFGIGISRKEVRFMRPRPDWRRSVNMKGEPPVHIALDDGKIPEAEFIF
ncbi:hypothetical protein DFS33DRAFT_1359796 [Desarmillaria ectypa]|nr:hypothetical protein DFS33DRAFT_1359796 [Desarmillaria ectypa]